jgi:glutamate/tyrosine decarboxylase-like PLP-dependent enzyme
VNNQKGTMRYFASACGDERTALGLRSAKSDAPVPLNIVCFRYSDQDLSNSQLNELNEELMVRLQESGVAVILVPFYTAPMLFASQSRIIGAAAVSLTNS